MLPMIALRTMPETPLFAVLESSSCLIPASPDVEVKRAFGSCSTGGRVSSSRGPLAVQGCRNSKTGILPIAFSKSSPGAHSRTSDTCSAMYHSSRVYVEILPMPPQKPFLALWPPMTRFLLAAPTLFALHQPLASSISHFSTLEAMII